MELCGIEGESKLVNDDEQINLYHNKGTNFKLVTMFTSLFFFFNCQSLPLSPICLPFFSLKKQGLLKNWPRVCRRAGGHGVFNVTC